MDNYNNDDDFAGFLETDVSDVDFFSVEDGQESEKEESQTENPPSGENQEEEESQEGLESNLFDEAEEDQEESFEGEENEEDQEEEENSTESESVNVLNALKQRGLLDYELAEGEELTEEKAEELLEDSMDNLFEERIEELFENVPDIVKEMNKFVIKGGDINVFLESVAKQKSTGLSENMDLEDEQNQELIIRQGLLTEGYDEEYITAQIEFLKDSKRLKKHSETHFKKWNDKRKADQKAILKSQDQRVQAEKIQRRELKNKVSTFLNETEEVTGFSVTKQDRKILPNYMSDRTIKLENGNQITGMQRDLMRVLNSPTGSVQIAKLLKAASEEGELNFEEITKHTKTKVTKEVRENVRRNKKSIISQSGGKSKKRPLTDYFD